MLESKVYWKKLYLVFLLGVKYENESGKKLYMELCFEHKTHGNGLYR